MKNIWKIFKGDIKIISKNTVAIVIIIGIAIVPSLYSWFNISASWDPYGNVSNLKIAVSNCDNGYNGNLMPIKINIGDSVIETLRETANFNWVITDKEDAILGVKSGKYYAAIVLPGSFSNDIMSLFSNDMKKASIKYYLNEKENAIAPKLTDMGASSIEKQVDEAFVENIVQVAINVVNGLSNSLDEDALSILINNIENNLKLMSREIEESSTLIYSYGNILESFDDLISLSSTTLESSQESIEKKINNINEGKAKINRCANILNDVQESVAEALDVAACYNDELNREIEEALNCTKEDMKTAENKLLTISRRIDERTEVVKSTRETIEKVKDTIPTEETISSKYGDKALIYYNEYLKDSCERLRMSLEAIIENLKSIEESNNEISNKISSLAKTLNQDEKDITQTQKEIKLIQDEVRHNLEKSRKVFNESIKPSIEDIEKNLNEIGDLTSELLGQLGIAIEGIHGITTISKEGIGGAIDTLYKCSDDLKDVSTKIAQGSREIGKINESTKIKMVDSVISNRPEDIIGYISTPIEITTYRIFPIDNFGSAMTPFFTILSIWVGGTVLVAMIKVSLEEKRKKELTNLKEYELYLGRYLLFLCIGLVQTLIISLGDLFFLGIQCKRIGCFILACLVASIVFVNLIYTLTISFGDTGKAIAVILMVLQVAGSGGTFPIEMTPKFFRSVYEFLPFSHAMNMLKECICGFYKNTYWHEMGILGIYFIISLLVGLLLRNPIIKLNNMLEEKMEQTKLI